MIKPIVLNGRRAAHGRIAGIERTKWEIINRLVELDPDRYRVLAPGGAPTNRAARAAAQLWEQSVLPARARRLGAELIFSAANIAPLAWPGNVIMLYDAAVFRAPDSYSRGYRVWHQFAEARGGRGARAVITISEFSKSELVDVFDLDPDKIHVVPCGVGGGFHAGIDPEPVLARFALAQPYVLAVASNHPHKNPQAVAAVAAELAGQGIATVRAGTASLELPHVRSLGYVPDVDLPALYAGAAALLMPSTYEGFGLPCLEAMACGTPVVAADRAALPEACGDAAILIDPNDHAALAAAVLAAVTDDAIRARLRPAGLARAAQFSWERAARQTHELLSSLSP